MRRRAERRADEIAKKQVKEYEMRRENEDIKGYITDLAKEIKQLKEGGIPQKNEGSEFAKYLIEMRKIEKESEKEKEEITKDKESFKDQVLLKMFENKEKPKEESAMEKLVASLIESQLKGDNKKDTISKEDITSILSNNKKEIESLIDKKEKDQTIKDLSSGMLKLKEEITKMPLRAGGYASDDAKILAEGIGLLGKKMDHGHETLKTGIQAGMHLLPEYLRMMNPQMPEQKSGFTEQDMQKIEQQLDQTKFKKPVVDDGMGLLEKALGPNEISDK